MANCCALPCPSTRPPRIHPHARTQGDQDQVVAYALHRRLLALVPSCRLITIPGASHSLLAEEPERVMEAVDALLRGEGGGEGKEDE